MSQSPAALTTLQGVRRPLLGRALNGVGSALSLLGREGASFAPEVLLEEARQRTGLGHFGQEDFLVPLRILVDSLREEAYLSPVGAHLFRELILLLLGNRLEAERAIQEHPEVEREVIRKPVFVLGLARSGTTYLYDLFSKDPASRPLLFWEVQAPAPARGVTGGREPRIGQTERFMRKYSRLTTWDAANVAHRFAAQAPEECTWLLKMTFVCRAFGAWARVPSYMAWHEKEGYARLGGVYREYRRLLQLLQWQRSGGHFVLKSPSHLWYLDGILENFPDAQIVQTHRNLLDVVGSHCSLIALIRYMFSERIDFEEIGRFAMDNIATGLERMMRIRREAPTATFVDVAYDRLVADPLNTVKDAYAKLGLEFTPELQRRLEEKKTARGHDKSHSYRLEQFGLNAGMVRERFKTYSEAFGVGS